MVSTEPAFRRALAGFSGAELTLFQRRGLSIVRKQARSSEQNSRLRSQAAKLAAANLKGLPSPAMLDEGEEHGRYWFEMEYIAGQTVAHAIISGSNIDWPSLISQISAVLDTFRENSTESIPDTAFLRKLQEIMERCGRNEAVNRFVDLIGTVVARLSSLDWSGVPQGPCHGDMTLENVLIRQDGQVIFIDFDVPDQGSFALDIGKLYQDLYGEWFLRRLAINSPESVELFNVRLRLARVVPFFNAELEARINGGRATTRQLAAFHLMRTLPYANESRVPHFVLERIMELLRSSEDGLRVMDFRRSERVNGL